MLRGLITKHQAGEIVPSGIYLSRKNWDLTILEEGGRLPTADGEASVFYQLPVLLVMLLSPVVGLAFVLFLIVAVPAMVVYSVPKAMAAAIHRRGGIHRMLRPGGHRRWSA